MAERLDVLSLTGLHQLGHAAGALFLDEVVKGGRPEVREVDWSTSARSIADVGARRLHVVESEGESILCEVGEALVRLTLFRGRVYATAAAKTTAALDAAISELRELLPVLDPSAAHEVPVSFWTYTRHGPMPNSRSVAVPGWDEIAANYAAATRTALDRLMAGFKPAHGGQLVLWHGLAGTGKTFALRALAWEWRDWCQLHYIVDPDSFFGEHADYLMSVLLQPTWTMTPVGPGMVVPHEAPEDADLWRLLVLEDTGELLTPDAKAVIGQGLSRFLNVVDGLIGQGLRVLVLVTTNEPIATLHPAVARPGRCAANIEFLPLSSDEAAAWLGAHELEGEIGEPVLLAELYGRLKGEPAESAAFAPA